MKKLITICFIMAATFTMHAQKKATAQKTTTTVTAAETGPTKEETIVWLKEKLTLYYADLASDAKFLSNFTINECEIVIQYKSPSLLVTYKFPIKGMTFMASSAYSYNPADPIFSYKFDAVSDEWSGAENTKHRNNWHGIQKDFKSQGELDLVPRMQKAFAHLATFCQEKKEKF